MRAVVTGGAGFIGSAVSEALIRGGWEVTIFDNLSSGSKGDLADLSHTPLLKEARIIVGDCTRLSEIKAAVRECDTLFHFAANPEVRMELSSPEQCFTQNVYATHNVLEAFRNSNAEDLVFASTSTVYGDAKNLPTPENYAPLEPISIYGASKLAGEALLSSYCHAFNKHGVILRFANVVGPRSKHGVVTEFFELLDRRPEKLEILGDGSQTKSYIHINDCVRAIMSATRQDGGPIEVFNVGSEDSISVKVIGMTIAEMMGLPRVRFKLNGGVEDGRGWVGDVKTMLLDITRLKSTGWRPELSSLGAIEQTVKSLLRRNTDLQIEN